MIEAIFSLMCGMEQGTAVATDRGVLSAAHVATAGHCSGGTFVLGRVTTDRKRDYVVMQTNQTFQPLKASCEGIIAGQTYTIVGYPQYGSGVVSVDVVADGRRHDISGFIGLHSFTGRIQIGMSGGPVLNSRGEVVAIATAVSGRFSLAQSLSETVVC